MLFPSATITRPADVTAYATDAIIGVSKAAAQAPTPFRVADKAGGKGYLSRLRLTTTNFGGTLPAFRLWLFGDIGGLTFAGVDGALFAILKAHFPQRLGYVDFSGAVLPAGVNDSAEYFGSAPDQPFPFVSDGLGQIYGLLTVRAAYTPASAEVLGLSMVADQT